MSKLKHFTRTNHSRLRPTNGRNAEKRRLLLTRIFDYVAPRAESQRDSATKPRVARNELPWENARHIGDNPERVVADDNGNKTMPQPRWGCESEVALPRVARSSQPWAELHNPFGIEDAGKEQRLAGAFTLPRHSCFALNSATTLR